jgi:hypothetical protein
MDGDGKVPRHVFELDGEQEGVLVSRTSSPAEGQPLPAVSLPPNPWDWGSRTGSPAAFGGAGSGTSTPPSGGTPPNEPSEIISGEIGLFWELTDAARERGNSATWHAATAVPVPTHQGPPFDVPSPAGDAGTASDRGSTSETAVRE